MRGVNFMLSWVEYEKSFITLGLNCGKRVETISVHLNTCTPLIHYLALSFVHVHQACRLKRVCSACAYPESFVRGSPTLTTIFFSWWGEGGSKFHYSRPSSACQRNAFCWCADDGRKFNAGLVIFRGSGPCKTMLRYPIFLYLLWLIFRLSKHNLPFQHEIIYICRHQLEFLKFRSLDILNFHPCVRTLVKSA